MGFSNLGGFIVPLNPNIVVLKTAVYQDVNLFHEPLIAVDRLLGVIGSVHNDKV